MSIKKIFLVKKVNIVIIALVGMFLVFFYGINIGVNNNFFIKRDFNKAFNYRTAGDCDAFTKYINKDVDKWKADCEKEKSNSNEIQPIRSFEIQKISNSFGSSRAFLQVELKRNYSNSIELKEGTYSVNYELQKVGLTWKIDQEKF